VPALDPGGAMYDTSSGGLLLGFARVVLFTFCMAFALGWLFAPEMVARERHRVASLLHGWQRPASSPVSTVPPPADAGFRNISASVNVSLVR
jgi:hypothetical protein